MVLKIDKEKEDDVILNEVLIPFNTDNDDDKDIINEGDNNGK